MKLPLELTLSDQENRRQAYRVSPGERVRMTIRDEPVKLLDISETGIAFESDDHIGDKLDEVVIFFTVRKSYRLKPKLKVMFNRNGHCGAEFVDLSERAHLALSELVIEIQKDRIRAAQEEKRANQENDGA
ncbi:PilZ domain-containing protein [Neptuniibacter sp.]|uniref:PilZ domain-containing protein n=1 Tax=Neptuniibacter sp. TaxID=1962643 RepID=UPI002606F40C|nr:PilZ domain-containing protein [Neptuniibacter sp.]MCP4597254.1 PilZ domain-containing protein [Neptuniibacter sp.]